MKKNLYKIFLVFGIVIFQSLVFSTANAKHYFVHSSYTENYRGSADSKDNGVRRSVYIDSENIGIYKAGGVFVRDKNTEKNGIFRVRVIEVWDWDKARKNRPKQQVFQKDYYFFRYSGLEYSIFGDYMIGYIFTHDIPGETISDTVIGVKRNGIRCSVPRWVKNGHNIYRDELVQADDGSLSDGDLLKIYEVARKIYLS